MTHDSSDIGTIVHLPECPMNALPRPTFDYVTTTWPDGEVKEVKWECVCPLLRACEQRIKQSITGLSWYSKARWTGYYEGVDAAEAAAAGALICTCLGSAIHGHNGSDDRCPVPHVVAAIRALKEKP